MCTFEECSHPNKTYGSRHEWYDHEAQTHRAQWLCRECQEIFTSEISFIGHLKRQHPSSFAEEQLPAVLHMCLVPADKGTVGQCDLCFDSGQLLYKHMAHHMKALALFAVPRKDDGKYDDLKSNEGQDGTSDDASIGAESRGRLSGSDSTSEISEDAMKVPEYIEVENGELSFSGLNTNDEFWTAPDNKLAEKEQIHNLWDRAYQVSMKKSSWPPYEKRLLQELGGDASLMGSITGNHLERERLMSKFILKRSDIMEDTYWALKSDRSSSTYRIIRMLLLVKDDLLSGDETNQHTALAWAGIFMLLPYIKDELVDFQGNEDMMDLAGLEEALECMSVLINRLTIMQQIYLKENADFAVPDLNEKALLKASFETQMTSLCSRIVSYQAVSVYELLVKMVPARKSPLPQQVLSLEIAGEACQEVFSLVNSAKLEGALTRQALRIDKLLYRQQMRWQSQQGDVDEAQKEDPTDKGYLNQAHASKCLEFLHTSSFEDGKNQIADRAPGTCQWVLGHQRYNQWLQDPSSSILWVYADPGCGKSVLLRSLVDNELQSTDLTTTCYYFFRDDVAGRCSVVNALYALIYQLCDQKRALLGTIDEVLRLNGGKMTLSLSELWKLLISLAQSPAAGRIICLLDALDECEENERSTLMTSLRRWELSTGETCGTLKFLVTSRSPLETERNWDSGFLRVCGSDEREVMKKDIDTVIRNQVPLLATQKALDEKSQAMVLSSLLEMQNPTQLWLHLTLAALEETAGVDGSEGVSRFIDKIPKNLKEAYGALLRLSPHPERASKLLHIVVAAVRPLTLRELNMALNLIEGQKSIRNVPLHKEEGFADYVDNLCGSIVCIYHGRVYLIHKTVKEWWAGRKSAVESHRQLDVISRGWVHPSEPVVSHLVLARICLAYIGSDVFEYELPPSNPIEEGKDESSNQEYQHRQRQILQYAQNHDLMNYAAINWPHHFRLAGRHSDLLQRWNMVCETRSKRFHTWFRIYWYGHHMRNDLERSSCKIPMLSNLALASYLRHSIVVSHLIERGHDNDSGRVQGWSALITAIEVGDRDIVKHLLNSGASVDFEGVEGWTPLGLAAAKGFDDITLSLMKKGADVEQQTRLLGITALMRASEAGQRSIVEGLLSRGADVNTASNKGETALMYATSGGRKAIVEFLIGRGADVEACSYAGLTALHDAIHEGYEKIAQILLEHDAPPDPEDENERTPLSWAAQRGLVKSTRLLIARGVRVDSMDDEGLTPLLYAVRGGRSAIVQLLLAAGADVNSSDEQTQTALSHSVQLKDETTIRILLEHKADTESPDERGLTPLLHASLHGNTNIMKILLDAGADPEATDNNGQTSLLYVLDREFGMPENVSTLYRAGANVNATDQEGRTALSQVSYKYKSGVKQTRALVNAGADVNIADHKGRTPIHYAIAKRRQNLEVLLVAGADVNKKDAEGKSPMDLAKEQGDDKVIAVLERRN